MVPYTKIAINITFRVCQKCWQYKNKGAKDDF